MTIQELRLEIKGRRYRGWSIREGSCGTIVASKRFRGDDTRLLLRNSSAAFLLDFIEGVEDYVAIDEPLAEK